MGVEDILVFYYLSFKDMFVFFAELWRCRTRVLVWRKKSSILWGGVVEVVVPKKKTYFG